MKKSFRMAEFVLGDQMRRASLSTVALNRRRGQKFRSPHGNIFRVGVRMGRLNE